MITSDFSFFNNKEQTSSLFEEVVQIMILINEAKIFIQEKEHLNNDIYLKPIIKLETIFKKINLHGSWDSFKKNFDIETMTALKFSSDVLSRESNEKILNEDEINNLLEKINIFQESLFESTIDKYLKEILLEKSESLRKSIINYKIYGINGLRRSVESGLGAIFVNQEIIKTNDSSQPYWKSFFEIVTKANALVGLCINSPKLLEGATKLISGVVGG